MDPKKRIIFNPEESIDFHGFTGSFVQYTHARIKSVLRKENPKAGIGIENTGLLPLEKELIIALEQYPGMIEQAATEFNPSVVANYVFQLARIFNSFYTGHSIASAETEEKNSCVYRYAL